MRALFTLLLTLTAPVALAAEAEDFTLPGLDDQPVQLASFGDGPVLINFWATWCGPCKDEMPHLQKLHDTYKSKGFTVLSVSTDDARSARKVAPYIQAQGYTFPVVLDKDSKVIARYNPSKTLPYTVIVHKGEVVKTHAGYNPGDELKLGGFVAEILGADAPAPAADAPAPAADAPAGKSPAKSKTKP